MGNVTSLSGLTTKEEDDFFPNSYPICVNFSCPEYWADKSSIFGWTNIILRMSIAILIFLLGTKMPKDFMRSITMAIFIPIFLSEIFNVYREVVAFIGLFCESQEASEEFQITFVTWTDKFISLIFDYIHYNCLVMTILLLHCCRLATKPGDHINLFPINTICMILQVIPFFFSMILYIEQDAIHTNVMVISLLSRIVTVLGFAILFAQIVFAIPILFRELPYGHAAAPDIQLQDARSRLAWTLVYAIIPFLSLWPFVIEAISWTCTMGHKTDDLTLAWIQKITEVLEFLVNYFRSTWLVVLTMAFLPPYRRAVPLLFCSCSCCPSVKVDSLPRKQKDTSNMYRHADA